MPLAPNLTFNGRRPDLRCRVENVYAGNQSKLFVRHTFANCIVMRSQFSYLINLPKANFFDAEPDYLVAVRIVKHAHGIKIDLNA